MPRWYLIASTLTSAILLTLAPRVSHAQTWRAVFESSPATFAPFSPEMEKVIADHTKGLTPQMVHDLTGPKPLAGTVRYRLLMAGEGAKISVRLSNEDGSAPLKISAASVGLAADGFTARAGSIRPLTFGGSSDVTIPVGAPAVSDPVDLPIRPGVEIVVSASLASPMMNETRGGALFVVAPNDQVENETLQGAVRVSGRPLATGVSALSSYPPRVIVAMGDSITDGNRSALGVLHSWPEELSRRLSAAQGPAAYTVLDAGITGNRLLTPGWGDAGLSRLDRDVLRIEGVTALVLLEGTNDIGMSGRSVFGDSPDVSAADLIAGYRQVIRRAHARGIKVFVGTLTATAGSQTHSSPSKDLVHATVNRWIRSSGEPDGVIDFDRFTRDPAAPQRLRPAFDSGDHLHPNDAGYKAMADDIDLSIFK